MQPAEADHEVKFAVVERHLFDIALDQLDVAVMFGWNSAACALQHHWRDIQCDVAESLSGSQPSYCHAAAARHVENRRSVGHLGDGIHRTKEAACVGADDQPEVASGDALELHRPVVERPDTAGEKPVIPSPANLFRSLLLIIPQAAWALHAPGRLVVAHSGVPIGQRRGDELYDGRSYENRVWQPGFDNRDHPRDYQQRHGSREQPQQR
jgi:hypothetical protein